MKNKHRIKQGLSLLLAGGIALTNLGAALPAFAEDAPATPETASAATPETAEANVPTPNLSQITENLYDDLPDAPTGSYLGSMGLPVATGETKIGISAWASDLYDGVDAHMDADALNADENTVTIGKTPGTDYAIVPLLAQVEYPADGAVSEIILPDGVELLSYRSTDYEPIPADEQEQAEILHQTYSEQSAAATGLYSADGTKLLDAGTKLATGSATNASGFAWFDVDVPVRSESYPDSGNSGRYRIVEITAPAGYLLDSTPVDVEFTYEGQQIAWQIVDGTNTNLRTSVDISKQDITNGKELPGAKLEIRDADGSLVEDWTSGKVPHTVRGLELEKEYTLTETRAPDGYVEAESIVFKLVQEGTEQVNEVYVKSDDDWVKLDDATVVMQDAPVLDIDKTDIAGNLLPGATLTIRDADGEVIDTWVTDYKTHRVPISDEFIKLSGETKEYIYTLTEDAAPAGFEIAESVQFKVQKADESVCLFVRKNADAEWTRAGKRLIQMIDEATPREDTPTPTPAPTPQPTPAATPAPTPAPTPHKVQTLPQTGDGFPLLAIVVVSLASATGIVLLTVKKNALKKTSDEEDADESADR